MGTIFTPDNMTSVKQKTVKGNACLPYSAPIQLDPDEEGLWLRQPHRERAGNHTLRKVFYLEEADAGVGGDLNASNGLNEILVAVAAAGQEVKVERNRCRCVRRANCRRPTIC